MIYTDNYQLRKPVIGDDNADVGDLNYNSDRIDAIMHASQVSLANAYDQTATYNTGDVVMYELLMYKCKADGTTGNWDASKWERTTAAETGGGEVDFDLYGEASGNPASFADGSESALVKCEFDFEPKQDLHGYSKPWAGGTGKNVLPMRLASIKANNTGGTWNGNVYTLNNLTFEVLIDSDENVVGIKVNGTNTATYTRFTLSFPTLESGTTYTLSGAPSGYSGTDATIYLGNSQATIGISNPAISGGVPATFTPTQTGAPTANLNVNANVRVDNAIFYPQIEVGSTATTFEPYTNICPIEGYDEITINVSPTNDTSQGVDTTIQLGDTYYSGTLNAVTGELVIDKIFVEMDDVTWTALDSSGNKYRYYTDIVGMKKMAVRSMDILCSCYETNMGGGSWDDNTIWNSTNLNRVIVVTSQYQTANAFMASLTDQTMLVDMETPLVIQIPPTVINTLLGQNYISSEDTEDIDLVYVKSTASIKPNPSGTPSGELRSIDIGGEIFEIIKELPTFSTTDGDYKLKLSVSSGVPTLSWVSDT